MGTLDYKGVKSTRVILAIVFVIAVTIAYIWSDVTAEQWIDFLKWSIGTYTLSEVGAKGAAALKR